MNTFRSDWYTKAVLTLIAGALLWLCVCGEPVRVSAQASTPPRPTPVVIVGWTQLNQVAVQQLGVEWGRIYGNVRGLPVPTGLVGTAYDVKAGRWSYDPRQPVPIAIHAIQNNEKTWDAIKTIEQK